MEVINMDIKKIRNNVVNAISDKSPEILIGFGLAGMLTSTVLAVKATPKALDILEQEDRELSKVDKVKLTWKCYAPAAIGYCASAACIIGANSVNSKRNAVLAGAYKISEAALLEYRDKVTEVLGEEKEKEIRDSIAEDRVRKTERKGEVIVAGKGDTLCYDMHSGRYFKSNMDEIKRKLNEINYKLMQDNILSVNDFYDQIGLDPINTGYDFGWLVDDGLIQLYFTSILTEDGQPCLAVHFDNMPRMGYDRLG
jgi:hypothetical protein